VSSQEVEVGLYRDCERTRSFLALVRIRLSTVESGHDCRGTCLPRLDSAILAREEFVSCLPARQLFRWQTDGSGDGQQDCHSIRHGLAKGGLQTFDEPGRNLVEPQARLGGVTLAGAAPFESCDVNTDSFPSDQEIGVGGITALFPRCREASGDGFDGGSFLLLQIPHGLRPSAPALRAQLEPRAKSGRWRSPASRAFRTARVRSRTPSLARMLETWFLMVPSAVPRASAISLLL
jgi:hypothetical protein